LPTCLAPVTIIAFPLKSLSVILFSVRRSIIFQNISFKSKPFRNEIQESNDFFGM
jgi:hypothetical protein